MDLGLDARNVTGVERYALFRSDGPTTVRAEVSDASGRSRICIWRNNDVANRLCKTVRNGAVEWPVFEAAPVDWTVSLIGASETIGPTVDLTIDFNATLAAVQFQNVRFHVLPSPDYNGIHAAVDTLGEGTLTISGVFDEGESHHWQVVIREAGVGSVQDQTGGPSPTFAVTHPVTAVTTFLVSVSNPSPAFESAPAFVTLSFSWP